MRWSEPENRCGTAQPDPSQRRADTSGFFKNVTWSRCRHYIRIICFYQVVTLVYLEKKNVILERRLDFADILQRIKNEKKVKDLKIQVVLNSLRTVWRVFDTFFIFQAKQN